MEPEELRKLIKDFYDVDLDLSGYDPGSVSDRGFDSALWDMVTRKKTKKVDQNGPKKFAELEDLSINYLSLIKTSIEKYEAGYRPYLIDIENNVFRPLNDLDEVDSIGHCKFVWLLPKIAEKIIERFESIIKIEKELDDFIKNSHIKINEYEDRIRQILDKGHDLLL